MTEYTKLIELVVNDITRVITIPNNNIVLGVVGDIEVNKLMFKMPRYYCGFDMSEFTPKINYVTPNAEGNYYKSELEVTDDVITFTWLLTSDVTEHNGTVKFSISLYKKENGRVSKVFNSRSSVGNVLEGLNVDAYVTPEQQQTILDRLETEIREDIQSFVTEKEASINQQITEKSDAAIKAIDAKKNDVLSTISEDQYIQKIEQNAANVGSLRSDLTLINELVVSVSLEEKIATTTDFSAKSIATLNGNHYTSTDMFGGIGGFKNGNHYKLVFVPEIGGYYALKTILSGAYRDTILPNTYIPGNEPYVIDIPDTIDFSNANKYMMFLKGNTYCESADLFVYDVSRISEEVLANIDFTTCANPVVYQSIDIPQKTFKNALIAENILYGKDASFLGDSLTAAGSGSQYIGYVKDGLGLSAIHNCGIGGTRVSSGNVDGTSFWTDNRVNSLSLDSDCLFIMGGTNDAPYTTVQDSDFTIDNHDTNNFVGAYNVLISKVLYKYLKLSSGYYSDIDYSGITQVEEAKPYFRIILITPPKRFDSLSNLQKVEKFADYVIRIAEMWGIPVCDVNHQMNMNIINKDIYFSGNDYIHFNVNAHKELANIVIGKVKSLN